MFPSLRQKEQQPKSQGQGTGCPGKTVPSQGLPTGFHRGLELTSVSKTASSGGQAVPSPGVGSGGPGEAKSMEIHTWGRLQENPLSRQ